MSTTLIVWLAVAEWPHPSVAVQVLVTLRALAQAPADVTSANASVAVPQASVAVGVANTGEAGHSIVVGPGNVERVGLVVSTTLIVWLAVALLPQASVVVQVRVTLRALAQAPAVVTSANVSVVVPQASVAVGVTNTGEAGHSIVVGPGKAEMLGGVVSTTLIVWLAVALLPQASVAVQVRVTLRALAQAPAVVTSANVSVDVPQASVAVGVANTGVAGH